MPRTVRREVLVWLRTRRDGTDVRARTAEIAARIDDARSRGVAVGEATARWAELARQVGSPTGVDSAGRWFDAQTAEAVRTGDLARAAVLVATGESLAEAIGEPFASVVRLAARRVALAHRRTQDDRHLATFLERREQTDALRALLDPRATSWATHFLGMGGVGKTMLIRHLTARWRPSSARRRRASTSTISTRIIRSVGPAS